MANYYVDFSATYDGDGTSPTQAASAGAAGAYNTIVSKTFSSGSKVWMRRVTSASFSAQTISTVSVSYVGWPKYGDPLYATRPEDAKSLWDDDTAEYTTITCASTTAFTITADHNSFYRLKFADATNHSCSRFFDVQASAYSAYFYHCWFGYPAYAGGYGFWTMFVIDTYDVVMTDCYFQKFEGSAILVITSNAVNFKGLDLKFNCNYGSLVTIAGSKHLIKGMQFNGNSSAYMTLTCSNSRILGIDISSTTSSAISAINVTPNEGNEFEVTRCYSTGTTSISVYKFTADKSESLGKSIYIIRNVTSSTYLIWVRSTSSNVNFNLGRDVFKLINCTTSDATYGFVYGAVCAYGYGLKHTQFILQNSNSPLSTQISPNVIKAGCYVRRVSESNDFCCYTENGSLVTSNTTRVGGMPYSYCVRVLAAPSANYGTYGLFAISDYDPELIWLQLKNGTNTLTMYGAYKNYDASDLPTDQHTWFEVDYIDVDGIAKCGRTSDFLADGSTWDLDPGYTAFKIQINLITESLMTCPVRLYLGCPVHSSGYLYLDPRIIIS